METVAYLEDCESERVIRSTSNVGMRRLIAIRYRVHCFSIPPALCCKVTSKKKNRKEKETQLVNQFLTGGGNARVLADRVEAMRKSHLS